MLAYIKGSLEALNEDSVIVEAGNIGYTVLIPTSIINELPSIGSDIKLYTYLNVREDGMTLFGFLTNDDVDVFKKLITVNGIGPKGAMAILSTLSSYQLRMAIMSDDVKQICLAPGIGKKTAQKLILDLKDKLKIDDYSEFMTAEIQSQSGNALASSSVGEAIEALVALGYSNHEALMSVKGVDDSLDVESIIKIGLKKLAIM